MLDTEPTLVFRSDLVGVSSVQFSTSLLAGTGVLLYRCESRLGMACVLTMECGDFGSACKGVGSVWIGGRKDEDKLGVCVCDNQHKHGQGGCRKNTRKIGEACSSSKQCQKVKAVCREETKGRGKWCTCLRNKHEDKKGLSVSLPIHLFICPSDHSSI